MSKTTALIQKLHHKDSDLVNASGVLEMATLYGENN